LSIALSCEHPNTTGLGIWGNQLASVLGKAESMEKVRERMEREQKEEVILE